MKYIFIVFKIFYYPMEKTLIMIHCFQIRSGGGQNILATRYYS